MKRARFVDQAFGRNRIRPGVRKEALWTWEEMTGSPPTTYIMTAKGGHNPSPELEDSARTPQSVNLSEYLPACQGTVGVERVFPDECTQR